jgi:hypothetical protein
LVVRVHLLLLLIHGLHLICVLLGRFYIASAKVDMLGGIAEIHYRSHAILMNHLLGAHKVKGL